LLVGGQDPVRTLPQRQCGLAEPLVLDLAGELGPLLRRSVRCASHFGAVDRQILLLVNRDQIISLAVSPRETLC